MKTAGNSSQ